MYEDLVGQDLTGLAFEDMLVLRERKNQKNKQIICDCLCSCGDEFKTSRHSILKRNRRYCAKCSKQNSGKKKIKDLTGMRFGRLLVISYYGSDNNRSLWLCLCDCGEYVVCQGHQLQSGCKKSCGCLQREVRHNNSKFVDLTGKRFEECVVLYRIESDTQGARWMCLCDCGEYFIAHTKTLNSGTQINCGKHIGEKLAEIFREDLTGRRFNHVTVTGLACRGSNTKVMWNYLCDCGRCGVASASNLKSGKVKSCGYCIRSSYGEERVERFLTQRNINFQRQKRFIGCKSVSSLMFDFYLTDYNIAIEYDGEMHYKETTLGNDLLGQQQRDEIKNQYCNDNDIIILRIPYWDFDNIESILTDWLFLNDADEANLSDVDLSA